MKHLITIVFLFLFTMSVSAQSKIIEHHKNNIYSFISYTETGEVHQKGYFYKIDDEYLAHGQWIHSNGQKATFERGKMISLTTQNGRTFTEEELQLIPLIPKLKEVEQKLITQNN